MKLSPKPRSPPRNRSPVKKSLYTQPSGKLDELTKLLNKLLEKFRLNDLSKPLQDGNS